MDKAIQALHTAHQGINFGEGNHGNGSFCDFMMALMKATKVSGGAGCAYDSMFR